MSVNIAASWTDQAEADLPVNIEVPDSKRPIPARSIESVSLDLDPRKSLSPMWSFRKPYVYGASRLGLRPLVASD